VDILVHPASGLRGDVTVPGDKSIAHRAAIFAALAEGTSTIRGFPDAEDTQSTLRCLQQLGVSVSVDGDTVTVEGRGRKGFDRPDRPLECGNSGTTMRLLAGLLAGQKFDSVLTGDRSLLSRPMERIATPLSEMGAQIELKDGRGPIRITAVSSLRGIDYTLPVASAQVKSCVLIAGLLAEGETIVRESIPSRDHTERMLRLAVEVEGLQRTIWSGADKPLLAVDRTIPGDVSAAAFCLAAASMVENAEIRIPNVGLNPTRSGFLDVLLEMGASVTIQDASDGAGEPTGTLIARFAPLHAVDVSGPVVPRLIDEVPILAVTATQASGTTRINQVGELRHKETDRLRAMEQNLQSVGAPVSVGADRMRIQGPVQIHSATAKSFGDHRIAMAMAVAGLVADGPVTIQDAHAVRVSFPGFWTELRKITL
jgi:3-phosphoshikimate 1-carboxyvinyltransferase